MLSLKILLLLNIIVLRNVPRGVAERRITEGNPVIEDRKYMVYIFKYINSSWICGGAIININLIITSRACLYTKKYRGLYVVAGTRRYAGSIDRCIRATAKRIIRSYHMAPFHSGSKWRFDDLAVAQVHIPYEYGHPNYKKYCDYNPTPIALNDSPEFLTEGATVTILGWGSAKYRSPTDLELNYNQKTLMATTVKLISRRNCEKILKERVPKFKSNLTNMFCSEGEGTLTVDGAYSDFYRRDDSNVTYQINYYYDHEEDEENANGTRPKANMTSMDFRRHGLCENDHGGPVVMWIGGREVLVGISVSYVTDSRMMCTGPFMYTSTVCHRVNLQCAYLLADPSNKKIKR